MRVNPAILVILGIFFIVIRLTDRLPKIFRLFPHFRQSKSDKLKELSLENSIRLEDARIWLGKWRSIGRDAARMSPCPEGVRPKIDVVVVTTPRRGSRFPLTQTATKVSRLSRRQCAFDVRVMLCDVGVDRHREARALTPVFRRIKKPPDGQITDVFEKEKRDYVFCLNSTVESDYVLMLEDDGFPEDDFFDVLDSVLRVRSIRYPEYASALFLKLHHPERLLGYLNPEPCRLLELFVLATVSASVLLSCSKTAVRWSFWTLFVVIVIFLELFGRPNLLQLRRLHPTLYVVAPAPDCCTLAIMFPRRHIRDVVDDLNVMTCNYKFPKDAALDRIKIRHPSEAYSIQPNLVKHIGLYSTLRNKATVDPFNV